jgi:hypothetical protein
LTGVFLAEKAPWKISIRFQKKEKCLLYQAICKIDGSLQKEKKMENVTGK